MQYKFSPIAIVHSPFTEKFGIPRQPGLVEGAVAELELLAPYDDIDTCRGLEQFSHLWILFVFHQHLDKWQATVRPPRLGGNAKVGVFASRSSYRPNPIGMSVVENLGVSQREGKTIIRISGGDMLDGTPVLDIKPYITYADAIPQANSGYAQSRPEITLHVEFSAASEARLTELIANYPGIRELITQLISFDPRPAYQNDPQKSYAMRLYTFDIKFRVIDSTAHILSIE